MNWKIKKPLRLALLLLVALLALALAGMVLADVGSYSLSWSNIDAGGDTSSGTGYTLIGSAGQPDAGVLSSRDYKVSGGFWPGLRHQTEQKIFMPLALK